MVAAPCPLAACSCPCKARDTSSEPVAETATLSVATKSSTPTPNVRLGRSSISSGEVGAVIDRSFTFPRSSRLQEEPPLAWQRRDSHPAWAWHSAQGSAPLRRSKCVEPLPRTPENHPGRRPSPHWPPAPTRRYLSRLGTARASSR